MANFYFKNNKNGSNFNDPNNWNIGTTHTMKKTILKVLIWLLLFVGGNLYSLAIYRNIDQGLGILCGIGVDCIMGFWLILIIVTYNKK